MGLFNCTMQNPNQTQNALDMKATPRRHNRHKPYQAEEHSYLAQICTTAGMHCFVILELGDGTCWRIAKHILEAPDYDNYCETKTLAGIQMEKKTHVAKNLIAHEVHKCNESEWTRRRHDFTNWKLCCCIFSRSLWTECNVAIVTHDSDDT